MRRRMAVLCAGAAVAVFVVQSPAAASAAPPNGGSSGVGIQDTSCADNHVCLWEDFNYGGSKYVDYTQGTRPNDFFEIDGWSGDNEISSVKNNTDLVLVLWDNDGYSGTRACVNPNSSSSNLSTTHGFDNEAESFQLRSTC